MIKINDKYFEEYLSKEKINELVKELAEKIDKEYSDPENLVVVCVLNGAIPFFSDLIFYLSPKITIDCIKIASYGNETTSSGNVKLVMDTVHSVENKDVLLIEDIVDSGLSQLFLDAHFEAKKVKSVNLCSLFYKSVNNKTKKVPHFYGMDIPDYFIVGYGLDYAQKGRNLRNIVKLKEN